MTPAYVELAVTTNFSFLRGASHPKEFVSRPQSWAIPPSALPTATRLAAWCAPMRPGQSCRRESSPRLLIGARLVFRDGTPDILAYPKDRKAYGRLSRLISRGQSCAPKRANACWISPTCRNIATACC